jgi:hypothetical protein
MAAKNHVHCYVRAKWNKEVYQCDDPHCTHYKHKQYLHGKASICAVCHQAEIILGYEELRRAKPACANCSNAAWAKNKKMAEDVIAELFAKGGATEGEKKTNAA